MIERGLMLLVAVAIGAVISTVTTLSVVVLVLLDVALFGAFEAIRVKAFAALLAGAKSIPGLLIAVGTAQVVLPTPALVAQVFAGTIATAGGVGAIAYGIRRRRYPTEYAGRHWRRPGLSLTCLYGAVAVELFAAGAALTVPPIGPLEVGTALAAVPLTMAAFALQSPPRRGGSWLRMAVLIRSQDHSGHSGLTAGAR